MAAIIATVALPHQAWAQGAASRAEWEAVWRTQDPDPDRRIEAARSLVALATQRGLAHVVQMAGRDPDPRVRRAAIEAVGSTHFYPYAEAIGLCAERDPDPATRQVAARVSAELAAFALSPGKAAGLSLLCPGCGYFHLGQPGRAAAYLASTLTLLGSGVALLAAPGDFPVFHPPRQVPSAAAVGLPLILAAQNLWFYGVFASYRDARVARGDLGYRYPVSRESLGDLLLAPVRPRVLARPWFWLGLPLMVAAAVAYTQAIAPEQLGRGSRSLGDGGGVWFLGRHLGDGAGVALGETYYASLFGPVGVGEEALFRGVLQPALAEPLGLWPGWATASLAFGAVHVFNYLGGGGGFGLAAKGVPFVTGVGSYLGVVSIKTGHQLETSVALHAWYDFLLGTIAFLADPDHQPFALRIALPM